MTYGLTCANGQALPSEVQLRWSSRVRQMEIKYIRKALKALCSISIPLPAPDNKRMLKKWRTDKIEKAALRNQLFSLSGTERTVNPLGLKPAMT